MNTVSTSTAATITAAALARAHDAACAYVDGLRVGHDFAGVRPAGEKRGFTGPFLRTFTNSALARMDETRLKLWTPPASLEIVRLERAA